MWVILALITFVAGQLLLLRNLGKADSFLARQQESPEKEVLSLAFSNPDTAEQLGRLLEAFSRENPELDIVLHTDPSAADAVYEGRAAVGFLTENADMLYGLDSRVIDLAGLTAQRIVWKAGPRSDCTETFLRYLRQTGGNPL